MYDLYDLHDLAQVAGWEPYKFHALAHVPRLKICFTQILHSLSQREVGN